jgi:hypothetical protein
MASTPKIQLYVRGRAENRSDKQQSEQIRGEQTFLSLDSLMPQEASRRHELINVTRHLHRSQQSVNHSLPRPDGTAHSYKRESHPCAHASKSRRLPPLLLQPRFFLYLHPIKRIMHDRLTQPSRLTLRLHVNDRD